MVDSLLSERDGFCLKCACVFVNECIQYQSKVYVCVWCVCMNALSQLHLCSLRHKDSWPWCQCSLLVSPTWTAQLRCVLCVCVTMSVCLCWFSVHVYVFMHGLFVCVFLCLCMHLCKYVDWCVCCCCVLQGVCVLLGECLVFVVCVCMCVCGDSLLSVCVHSNSRLQVMCG